MINPWVILAVVFALGGFYGYGHHKGWDERDQEMQSEIAAKNEEARTKEQELNKQINEQSNKLQEANNAITQKQTDITKLIRSGSLRIQATSCVQNSSSPPLPAEVGTPREANLTDRLLKLLQPSSPKVIETPSNSTPVSQPTTK